MISWRLIPYAIRLVIHWLRSDPFADRAEESIVDFAREQGATVTEEMEDGVRVVQIEFPAGSEWESLEDRWAQPLPPRPPPPPRPARRSLGWQLLLLPRTEAEGYEVDFEGHLAEANAELGKRGARRRRRELLRGALRLAVDLRLRKLWRRRYQPPSRS